MLIIFDLDDTLIDTSNSLGPRRMEMALRVMVEAGLSVKDFSKSLTTLHELNATADCSHSALETFLRSGGYPLDFLSIGIEKLQEDLSPEDGPITTVPYALDMLKMLSQRHLMAIVTVGRPARQLSKLKKAGIDPSLFCKIAVVEEKNKKPSYKAIMDQTQIPSHEVIVCGDRLALDLLPAIELGCHTVHLTRGRGRHMREAALSAGVKFSIEDWRGFAELFEQVEKGRP